MSDDRVERRLAAIVATDMVGYSRLMEADEEGTLARQKVHRAELFDPKIAEHHGRIVKTMGDGLLIEFASAVDAVRCAVDIQTAMADREAGLPADRRIAHRIGVNISDIIIEGDDIYGNGVNIAARIEALADPGGILVSAGIHEQVRHHLSVGFEDEGERDLKNIDTPVKVYRVGGLGQKPAAAAEMQSGRPTPPADDRPSIVILPFENLTGDADQDYLSDGLRIDVQNALVKVSGVFLIAAGSANAYRGKPAGDATDGFGVRYALEGSVRKAGSRVRISTTLTDAASGEIVWAEQFDRNLDDAFELLDEVTGRILTAMNVELVAGEPARVWHKTLRDLPSLEALYRGIHDFFDMDRTALGNARRHFERVSQLHPEAAAGPTWMALTHWYDFQRGWTDSREESKKQAREWAERAAALADADGQAHTVLSHIHLLDRDFDAALAAGRGAIANRPNCTHANAFYANVLHYCGDQERALHHIDLAMRYSPIHPTLFKDILAATHRAAGDLDRATEAAQAAIAANPDDLTARLVLASIAVKRDQPDIALSLGQEIRAVEPAFSIAEFAAGQPYRSREFLDQFVTELRAADLPE